MDCRGMWSVTEVIFTDGERSSFYQTHGETLANGLKAGVDCFTDDGEIVYAAAREALDNGWITEKILMNRCAILSGQG